MIAPGTRLGRWQLVRCLGEGGATWLAIAADDPDDIVVVEVLRPHRLALVRERFEREAEALRALSHPAVPRVRDHGVLEAEAVCYLVVEHVDGVDLADVLALGPLTGPAARHLFRELAAGLAHAHAHGVQHRHLGPRRVRVRPDGGGVVVGFGVGREDGYAPLTRDGRLSGALDHLPPEAFERGARTDPRLADVYALGLLLGEALEGRPALDADPDATPDERALRVVAHKLERHRLVLGPEHPRDLADLVELATHPDPRRRLPSMAGFVDRLSPEEASEEDPSYGESTIFTAPHDMEDLTWELEDAEEDDDRDVVTIPLPPQPPSPVGARRGSSWGRVGLGALLAGAASATLVLAAWTALTDPTPPPRPAPAPAPVTVTAIVVPSGPVDRVVVGGFQAERGPEGFEVVVEPGPHRVLLAVGDCAGEAPACGACCACAEHVVDVGPGSTVLALAAPRPPEPVHRPLLVLVEDAGGLPVRVLVDDQLAAAADNGFVASAGRDGVASVRVDVGTCLDAATGCAEAATCPPGCWSTVREVAVACGEDPVEVRVLAQVPAVAATAARPERRRRQAPLEVAPEPASAPQRLEVRATGDRAGSVSDPAVVAAIGRLAGPVEQCWRRLAPPYGPLPTATLTLRLRRDGTVDPSSVAVEQGTGDAMLDACLRTRVRDLRAGAPTRPGKAQANFAFRVVEP